MAAERVVAAREGTHPDTGGSVTAQELAEFEQINTEASQRLGAAVEATSATRAAQEAIAIEQDRLVRDAETGVAIAKAQRAEALAPPVGGNGLAEARAELADANQALADLDAQIGTSIPANELVFLPQLPRVVQQVFVETGDIPQGAAMSVTGSGVVIRSSVAAADRPLMTEGVEGVIGDSNLGISLVVRVAFVGDAPGGPNVAEDRYGVRFEAVGELPEDAINQNLRVTVPFQSTDGAVLAVPVAALSAGADGSSRVQVERADGSVEVLVVRTGLLARSLGLVEISPVDGDLRAGDRVVVGRDGARSDVDEPASDEDGEEADDEEADE